jgi:hypothetical protein
MNNIDELDEHLARGRLAVFCGSDLPHALTGLPERAALAAGLAERHGLPAGLSLAATAQRVAQGGNRWAFTDFLSRQLDTFGRQPQRIHQILAQLPAQTIITTAYDNLLERALEQVGIPFNKLVRDSDLAFAERSRRMLIKLYGDLEQRDTLVITEDDHYGLWRSRDKESLLEKVRQTLRDDAVLFVGYTMADPDFLLLWREMLDRAGRFAIGAYALSPGMAPSERQMWEGRHVQVLDMEPLDGLERLAAAARDATIPSAATTSQDCAAPAQSSRARRCRDLAAGIDETLNLIKQYDDERRLADDPKARLRAERSIADLRVQLDGYQREQRELGCEG